MRTFTCEDFQIDLSGVKLTRAEENSWFLSNFFVKYTYPADIFPEEYPELIYHFNSLNYKKLYEGFFSDGKEISPCKMQILSFKDKKLSVQFLTGFDNFPNFDKKLSELPLESVSGITDIYSFAEEKIGKVFPETNCNFPAVHTDTISTQDYALSAFKGTFNLMQKRIFGSVWDFAKNEIDEDGILQNRNLMRPFPYLLHVLQAGFADAGYELSGDIKNIDIFKKILLAGAWQPKGANYPENVQWTASYAEGAYFSGTVFDGAFMGKLTAEQEILHAGRFKIKGKIRKHGQYTAHSVNFKFIYAGQTVFSANPMVTGAGYSFEFQVNTDGTAESRLIFEAVYPYKGVHPQSPDILEAEIEPLEIYDENGEPLVPTFEMTKFSLKDFVPDTTFGELVTALKNAFNFDLEIVGNQVFMNFIENKIRETSEVFDLSNCEIENPEITFSEAQSFLLRFQEENETYPLQQVFLDENGMKTGANFEKIKKQDTNEITSNLLPLPIISRNGQRTALQYGESGIGLLLYEPTNYGAVSRFMPPNLCAAPDEILVPALYENYWRAWLDFRRSADAFSWKFNETKGILDELNVRQKVHAYGRTHALKKISREDLTENSEEITIESVAG